MFIANWIPLLQLCFIQGTTGKACHQYYKSNTSTKGIFTSPNYPKTYPPNIDCIFHFGGNDNERVQIQFTDFDLFMPSDETKPSDCEYVDSVMIFITINEDVERINNYCGNETLPPQIMSNDHDLTIEFHSHQPTKSHVKGFRAIYRFVTDYGIQSDGQDKSSPICKFIYQSSLQAEGVFTSPNWPGLYPRETECLYLFYGHPNQNIVVNVTTFDIDGHPPCDHSSESDYLELSNYHTVDRQLPRFCGPKKPPNITSDREFFRVTFKSNHRFDGHGFYALYQFKNSSMKIICVSIIWLLYVYFTIAYSMTFKQSQY